MHIIILLSNNNITHISSKNIILSILYRIVIIVPINVREYVFIDRNKSSNFLIILIILVKV